MAKETPECKKAKVNEDCDTIFVVEIKIDSEWQTTPKIHHTKEDAEKEAQALKVKYPFLRECRITSRKK